MSILQKIEKLQEWEHIGVITTTGNTNSSDLAEFLTTLKDEYCRETSDMKSEKIEVYGTESGKLYIKPEDLFAQKKVQDVIKKAAMKSKTENSDKDDFDGWDNEYEFVKDVTSQVINKGNPGLDMEAVDDLLTLIGYKKLKAENAALREAVKEREELLRELIEIAEKEFAMIVIDDQHSFRKYRKYKAAIEKARNLIK